MHILGRQKHHSLDVSDPYMKSALHHTLLANASAPCSDRFLTNIAVLAVATGSNDFSTLPGFR